MVELLNITKSFHLGDTEVKVLNNVSLSISSGEFLAIMGPSGSGKSTLMNIIGCLDRPSSGVFTVNGEDVATLSADELAALRREVFGFIFQRYNLLPDSTAACNVEVPAIYAGMSANIRRQRATSLLTRLGLGKRTSHLPLQLSGGEQQRVSIARSLMNNPPIILADEPTGALDSKSGTEVLKLLHELHQEGRTVILITHDEAVAKHAERRIRISDGQIIEDSGQKITKGAIQKSSVDFCLGLSITGAIIEACKMALASLKSHLLRTAITLLGIVIGVAAVVVMLAVGTGSKERIVNQISSMGTNLLLVRPGLPGFRGGGDIVSLIPADATAVSALPNVEGVVPERAGRHTVRYGSRDYATVVQGASEALTKVRDWPAATGSFFSERDVTSYAAVALVGQTVLRNLFPYTPDPKGEYILIGSTPFQIIGTMSTRGASPGGIDQDDVVLIPYTTGLARLFGKPYLSSMTVRVADVSLIQETQDAIAALLKERHRTEDFNIRNMATVLETANEAQNTLTVMLGSVAAISLLVGGIGVMNIMLVNVTERTREIGVRMATGARTRDIMLQFNIESAVVCAIGGIIGLLIGYAIGFALRLAGIDVIFTVWPPVIAFGSAFLTGLLFGFLPAQKAARLDPVVALASE